MTETITTAHLDDLRNELNAIDADLLQLLNRRALLSVQAGAMKNEIGLPVFQPAREHELIQHLKSNNSGPLKAEHLTAIYREILSASRDLQRPLRVAFLGPEGTFSHMAALEHLGSAATFIPVTQFADIFNATESGNCDLGVVPLENSLYGTVGQSVDLFANHEVSICSEWYSRISHCLMSTAADLQSISVVYSHAQPLGQCAEWLRTHLPNAQQTSVASTAAGALRALNEPGAAAIGHKGLAERTGLRILCEGIEDANDNWTRFCTIHAQASPVAEANKTSLLFSLPDKVGSLATVLNVFAKAGINLSKLESRPMRYPRWKYIFFADVEMNAHDPAYATALQTLHGMCPTFRVLGVYMAGTNTSVPL